jgi:hypothetical protein
MDEYIFDSDENIFSNDVRVRILKSWAMYTAESRLISLELIPMKLGADNDVVVFGSGFMTDGFGLLIFFGCFCIKVRLGNGLFSSHSLFTPRKCAREAGEPFMRSTNSFQTGN